MEQIIIAITICICIACIAYGFGMLLMSEYRGEFVAYTPSTHDILTYKYVFSQFLFSFGICSLICFLLYTIAYPLAAMGEPVSIFLFTTKYLYYPFLVLGTIVLVCGGLACFPCFVGLGVLFIGFMNLFLLYSSIVNIVLIIPIITLVDYIQGIRRKKFPRKIDHNYVKAYNLTENERKIYGEWFPKYKFKRKLNEVR